MGPVGPGSGGSEVRDSMGLLGLGSGIRWVGSGGSGVWWVRECSVVQVQDGLDILMLKVYGPNF